jgi:hypothetical protein
MIPLVDPAANAALPGPEREVLALLAGSGLGYARIGELLGIGPHAVAEIAARARLRLAGLAPGDLPDACRARLPHQAGRLDGEAVPAPDPAHPVSCPACANALEAMRGADAAYRAWEPAAMPDVLRADLRARLTGPPVGRFSDDPEEPPA